MGSKENKIPKHIGIIMDGNRRWAKERHLPTVEGHRQGYEKMKLVPEWFFERGVEILSFYAFSTENWSRSQEEVNYLMKLLNQAIESEMNELHEKGYKVLISGRIDELPGDLPENCRNLMSLTKNNVNGIINICLNYGGRAEMIDVIKKILNNKIEVEQVHEGMIRKYLYAGELGDPDIIVRTSGEQRLSGFMLWQSVYSELLFLQKFWPEFEKIDVDYVLEEYNKRVRRFGANEDLKK